MTVCEKCASKYHEPGFSDIVVQIGNRQVTITFVPAMICLECYEGVLCVPEKTVINHLIACLLKKDFRPKIIRNWYSLLEEFLK